MEICWNDFIPLRHCASANQVLAHKDSYDTSLVNLYLIGAVSCERKSENQSAGEQWQICNDTKIQQLRDS